nr:MAG TPA: Mitogen-activated protein kinase kinase kinase [Caudoviricetes sp.]
MYAGLSIFTPPAYSITSVSLSKRPEALSPMR